MCAHFWMLNTIGKGICKNCGKQKDFSLPPIRFTELEKRLLETLVSAGKEEFYWQGSLGAYAKNYMPDY